MEILERQKYELACHVQTPSCLDSCNTGMFIVRDVDVAIFEFVKKLEEWTKNQPEKMNSELPGWAISF